MNSISDKQADRAKLFRSWIEDLTVALAQGGQPQAAFQAFDGVCAMAFGHRLFTILAWQSGSDELERVYTSQPAEYPLSARKRMGPTAWGSHVLRGGHAWLGEAPKDLQWAFPDYELIASLGCGSCLNAPVRWNKTVLGAVSVLDAEGVYQKADLDLLDLMSGFLVGPLLEQRAARRGG
jgi:hypothetical protein